MPSKTKKRNSVEISNYLSVYFPDDEVSIRIKLEKIAKKRKISVNALILDIFKNYLRIMEN